MEGKSVEISGTFNMKANLIAEVVLMYLEIKNY